MSVPYAKVPEWPGTSLEEARWLDEVVAHLAQEDGPADEGSDWPGRLWHVVAAAGGPRWSIPVAYGGEPCSRYELLRRYGRLAEGSLTAAFLLSQHDAAVRRLAAAVDPARTTAEHWLKAVGEGRAFATVGISHLTTSRRLGSRALSATPNPGGGYNLDGSMPWVTGAVHADVLVTGAFLADGRQLLLALPTDRPRVLVQPPFALAALQASCTSEVECDGVEISHDEVLAGPSHEIMTLPGQVGTGGLETSALALGLARAALAGLSHLSGERAELIEPAEMLGAAWQELAGSLLATSEGRPEAASGAAIRAQANALVLRATQAYLTARKGTGFLKADAAQRWARQALFFLVWSCPAPIANQAVRDLAGLCTT